jgi:uncharacterized protein YcbK (DUF882 family)
MIIRKPALAALFFAVATLGVLSAAPVAEAGSTSRSCLSSEMRSALARVEARFGTVQIVSTCRPGARIAGSGRVSRHASGNAVDFKVRGRKSEVVKWLVANYHSGGVMTYRGMDHIHIDVGYRFVSLNH